MRATVRSAGRRSGRERRRSCADAPAGRSSSARHAASTTRWGAGRVTPIREDTRAWLSGAPRSSTSGRTRSGSSCSRPPTAGGSAPTRSTRRCASARGSPRPAGSARRASARARATIEVFAHFCAAAGLGRGDVDAVATSAIRDARQRAGVPGPRARGDRPVDPRALARGGGPLRLPRRGQLHDAGRRRRARPRRRQHAARARRTAATPASSASWPLGAVRMTERFVAGRRPGEAQAARRAARPRRRRARARRPWLARRGPAPVGIGGTVRNLGRRGAARGGAARVRRRRLRHHARRRSTSWSSASPRCRPPSAARCRASSPRAPT